MDIEMLTKLIKGLSKQSIDSLTHYVYMLIDDNKIEARNKESNLISLIKRLTRPQFRDVFSYVVELVDIEESQKEYSTLQNKEVGHRINKYANPVLIPMEKRALNSL